MCTSPTQKTHAEFDGKNEIPHGKCTCAVVVQETEALGPFLGARIKKFEALILLEIPIICRSVFRATITVNGTALLGLSSQTVFETKRPSTTSHLEQPRSIGAQDAADDVFGLPDHLELRRPAHVGESPPVGHTGDCQLEGLDGSFHGICGEINEH